MSAFRAQELCESRGGRPGLPVPNSPYDLCGRKATLYCIYPIAFPHQQELGWTSPTTRWSSPTGTPTVGPTSSTLPAFWRRGPSPSTPWASALLVTRRLARRWRPWWPTRILTTSSHSRATSTSRRWSSTSSIARTGKSAPPSSVRLPAGSSPRPRAASHAEGGQREREGPCPHLIKRAAVAYDKYSQSNENSWHGFDSGPRRVEGFSPVLSSGRLRCRPSRQCVASAHTQRLLSPGQ